MATVRDLSGNGNDGKTDPAKVLNRQGAPIGEAVTPSDTVDFATGVARGLYIGGAGNVVAVHPDGTTVTLNTMTAGTSYQHAVRRVNDTNTTATNIVALY